MTSFLFSKLFYGIEIWSYELLNYETKKKLDSFYYKSCRLLIGDFLNEKSHDQIYKESQRATPKEISDFSLARTMLKANTDTLSPLHQMLTTNRYETQRRPGQFFYYNNSRIKIGKNCIYNRLSDVSKKINIQWTDKNYNDITNKLKLTFFEYLRPS